MTFFKSFQSKLALGSAALLTALSTQVSANSANIEVASGVLATLESGNLVVGAADAVRKKGAGELALSGAHSGTGKLEGSLYLDAGTIRYDNAASLGSNGVIMATGTGLKAAAAVTLTGPIALAAGAAVDLNINNNISSLPAIQPAGSSAVTINFKGATAQKDLTLGAAYKPAHADDKMTADPFVALNVGAPVSSGVTVDQLRILNGGNLYYDGTNIAGGFKLASQSGFDVAYTTSDSNAVYFDVDTYYAGDAAGSAYSHSVPRVAPNVDLQSGSTFKATGNLTMPKIAVVAVP